MSTDIYSSDIVFTPLVKAIQDRKGSRAAYARMEENRSWPTKLSPEMAQFVAAQTSIFMATANASGQPYIQHRGGPAGFLKVLDEATIAFVDFAGNRQFITQGNLQENSKAQLFLIDYANQQRVKIWGEASVVEGDLDLINRLMPADYRARPEQVIIFKVSLVNGNCAQHIPHRFEAEDVRVALAKRDLRIEELEAKVRSLKVQ